MTITVNTPDGSSFNFPDGTTRDVITNMLNRHFGTAPVTAPKLLSDADVGLTPTGLSDADVGLTPNRSASVPQFDPSKPYEVVRPGLSDADVGLTPRWGQNDPIVAPAAPQRQPHRH